MSDKMSIYQKVATFNATVLGIDPQPEVGELDHRTMKLTLVQLREEVQELEDAYDSRDFLGQVDAVIDLMYFAQGALYKMGVTDEKYERIFDAVNDANMLKSAGVKDSRGDHGAVDAVKPDAWTDPSTKIGAILND